MADKYVRLQAMRANGTVIQGQYVYVKGNSVIFNYKGNVNSIAELPDNALSNDLYLVNNVATTSIEAYAWNGVAWNPVPISVSGVNVTINGSPIYVGADEPNAQVYTNWFKIVDVPEGSVEASIASLAEGDTSPDTSIDEGIAAMDELS